MTRTASALILATALMLGVAACGKGGSSDSAPTAAGSPTTDASLERVESDPLWQQLPAVKTDQVTELDRLGYPGAAGLTRLYDELAETVG